MFGCDVWRSNSAGGPIWKRTLSEARFLNVIPPLISQGTQIWLLHKNGRKNDSALANSLGRLIMNYDTNNWTDLVPFFCFFSPQSVNSRDIAWIYNFNASTPV